MSPYAAVLFVHVLAAIVLVGHSLLAPVLRNVTCEASTVAALLRALDLERRVTRWNPAAALVLLASGVYLGSEGWWTEPWFHVSVGAWVANTLLAVLVLQRINENLTKAAADAAGPRLDDIARGRASRRWNLALAMMLANDLAVLFLMIDKPAWSGSVGSVVVVNAVAAMVFVIVRPQPAWLLLQTT